MRTFSSHGVATSTPLATGPFCAPSSSPQEESSTTQLSSRCWASTSALRLKPRVEPCLSAVLEHDSPPGRFACAVARIVVDRVPSEVAEQDSEPTLHESIA